VLLTDTKRYTEVDQNEKTSFSKVGESRACDYVLTFSDRQELHRLHAKFERTLQALDATVELTQCLQTLRSRVFIAQTEHSRQLQVLSAQTRFHRQKTLLFIRRLKGTAKLVCDLLLYFNSAKFSLLRQLSKILDFRSHEALTSISKAMEKNMIELRSISFSAQQDQSLLRQLALQAQKDSRTVRALALIATMSLPATLLAVCTSIVIS
jgi:hypothetical protein